MKPNKNWPHKRWKYDTWRSDEGWGDGRWHPQWRRKGGALFLRFAAVFGFMVLLFFGGLAIAAFLLTRVFGGDGQTALLVWILGCGLALAMPITATVIATRAFRSIATPLAGIMEAADVVAEGDLSVRVPEKGPGDFRRLAHSFNHMTEELERAEQRRRNLTADVAHELRTPLHIIQGNLEGILDGVYEPDEEHIGVTLEETHLLARLVEDLQTLSLAETGQLELVREAVDITELLDDVSTSFSGQAEAAGINLEIALEGKPAQMTVWADYGRLDQVLGNLTANAIRHTQPGGAITLRAAPLPGGVQISVDDTGDGISPEDLPYIFDRFWRGDPSRPHASGSSGLGLAIAQELVQAHGGHIRVTSQPSQGTTFTIELPADVRSY